MDELNIQINRLNGLNLSNYPIQEIRNIITDFGRVGVIVMTLHKGKTIIRARLNETNETIKSISELSYKPYKLNKTFQRASTPQTTMFYGCVVPENNEEGEPIIARVTSVLEVSNLYRKAIDEGVEKITFSRWVVTKDIPLIAMVYHKDFVNNSSHTSELYNAYKLFLQNNPSDLEKSYAITEFLASEFAKSETSNDFDYLISALYTELVVQQGFAGVYYPSVRAEGKGFNVAIHPYFVENCMIPIVAGECTLYKKGKSIVLDNDTITEVEKGQTNIVFKPNTNPKEHRGSEISNDILNDSNKKNRDCN